MRRHPRHRAIPIVYSLNRGLWIGIAISIVWVAVRLFLHGKAARCSRCSPRPRSGRSCRGHAAAVDLRATAGTSEQQQHPQLPVRAGRQRRARVPDSRLGRHTQDDRQRTSVAIGKTPKCQLCGDFSIGGNGQLWGVLFDQGLVGAAFYFGFFAVSIWLYRQRPEPAGSSRRPRRRAAVRVHVRLQRPSRAARHHDDLCGHPLRASARAPVRRVAPARAANGGCHRDRRSVAGRPPVTPTSGWSTCGTTGGCSGTPSLAGDRRTARRPTRGLARRAEPAPATAAVPSGRRAATGALCRPGVGPCAAPAGSAGSGAGAAHRPRPVAAPTGLELDGDRPVRTETHLADVLGNRSGEHAPRAAAGQPQAGAAAARPRAAARSRTSRSASPADLRAGPRRGRGAARARGHGAVSRILHRAGVLHARPWDGLELLVLAPLPVAASRRGDTRRADRGPGRAGRHRRGRRPRAETSWAYVGRHCGRTRRADPSARRARAVAPGGPRRRERSADAGPRATCRLPGTATGRRGTPRRTAAAAGLGLGAVRRGRPGGLRRRALGAAADRCRGWPIRRPPRALPGRAAEILAPWGLDGARLRPGGRAYLVELAARYLGDRQDEAGARLGDVGAWLLPDACRARPTAGDRTDDEERARRRRRARRGGPRRGVGHGTAARGPWRMTPGFLIVGASGAARRRCTARSASTRASSRPSCTRACTTSTPTTSAAIELVPRALPTAAPAGRAARDRLAPMTFESSPYYMFHPLAAERIADDLPGVKLHRPAARPGGAGVLRARARAGARLRDRGLRAGPGAGAERLDGEAERHRRRSRLRQPRPSAPRLLRPRAATSSSCERLEAVFGRDRMHVVEATTSSPSRSPSTTPSSISSACPHAGAQFRAHNARPRSPMAGAARKRSSRALRRRRFGARRSGGDGRRRGVADLRGWRGTTRSQRARKLDGATAALNELTILDMSWAVTAAALMDVAVLR